ncbi:MAG: PSD1 and planctomycete cytochrome C domain-containing protein [Planctomycetota bacterium]
MTDRYRGTVVTLVLALAARAAAAGAPDYSATVRPILARSCFPCHGPDGEARQAGLRLDDVGAARRVLASGAVAIVPGDAGASALVTRIEASDPDLVMPPPAGPHPLSAAERQVLRAWVEAGAPAAEPWALVAPVRPGLPAGGPGWIDRALEARFTAAGLGAAPPADPVTLVRRVHLDLTGIPPTPDEVTAYLADGRPDRWERLVDRLLASPRHAERMATWWLDQVRYADTVGYHGDQDQRAAPYRDWVIKAFLDDLPFDRFTILQLAGDLTEPGPGEHPDDRDLASCYNRLLQTSHEGGVQAREYRAIYQADRVRNLSVVWMAATIGCAQCHDHKFDPFTAHDFHALAAFFADVDDEAHFKDGSNDLPTRRRPERRVVPPFARDEAAAIDGRLTILDRRLPALVLPPWAAPEVAEADETVALRIERERLAARRAALEEGVMVTRALAEPREVRILPRGNWLDDSGAPVAPAVPTRHGRLDPAGRAGRLELARWLVTPVAAGGQGEMTARVIANRVWAICFGTGLCRSPGDFGAQGQPPDHPEILDGVALELLDGGWSLRRLLRTILTSRAYRRSSEPSAEQLAADPDNRLLARQGRWRLPAEHIRDTLLAVSGLLEERLGGETSRPYQPAGHYRLLNFPQREYHADGDWRQWRRGVYVHWQRTFLHPQLAAFDAPSREECTVARPRSSTPRAALVLLNDPSFVEAARRLADEVLRHAGPTDPERIGWLWRRVLSRPALPAEVELLAGLVARRREEYRADAPAAAALVAVGESPRDEALPPGEHAAWTAAARVVLNLHETTSRQ